MQLRTFLFPIPGTRIHAKEEGYIYVYVSNENATLVEVYFDDVVVTHTKSNIIQYNEYYPFGLPTANSWTRENTTGNNFLGNGGTELNTTSNLYDLAYRNYDPVLGRMNGIDPMASKYASLTPYNFSFNDPVTYNDPSGAEPPQAYGSRSPYHTFYTNDDRVEYYGRGEFYYSRSSTMQFHTGGRSNFFDGHNSYVNGRMKLHSILRGIYSALGSEFGGRVSIEDGSFTPFDNSTQARNAGGRYVNSTDGWGYVQGGKIGYLERIRPSGTVIRGSIFVDETLASDYDAAKLYLSKSKYAAKVISFLESNAVGMEIWDLPGNDRYYINDNVMSWQSKNGLELMSGYHSSSMVLMHELFHAFRDISNFSLDRVLNEDKWHNADEKFATKSTNAIARALGQGIRRSYAKDGLDVYLRSVNNYAPILKTRENFYEKSMYNIRMFNELQMEKFKTYWREE